MAENTKTFHFGQILVSKHETVLEDCLTGEKKIVPKGNRIVVGFDGFAHHLTDGQIQPFSETIKLKGLSSSGIIEVVHNCLFHNFQFRKMYESYEVDPDDICKELVSALEEIGLYENTDE